MKLLLYSIGEAAGLIDRRAIQPPDCNWENDLYLDLPYKRYAYAMQHRPAGAKMLSRIVPGDMVVLAHITDLGPGVWRQDNAVKLSGTNTYRRNNNQRHYLQRSVLALQQRKCRLFVMAGQDRCEEINLGELYMISKAMGYPLTQGAVPPLGFKLHKRRLVVDCRERKIMAAVLKWRERGHSVNAIYNQLCKKRINNRYGVPFEMWQVERLEEAERRLQALEDALYDGTANMDEVPRWCVNLCRYPPFQNRTGKTDGGKTWMHHHRATELPLWPSLAALAPTPQAVSDISDPAH